LDSRSCHLAKKDMSFPTKPNAPSLNPPADYLYGTPGHRVFLQDLKFICAQAVSQTYFAHPLHERVMRDAARSRARVHQALESQRATERAIRAA
jgi:hypothetical protein